MLSRIPNRGVEIATAATNAATGVGSLRRTSNIKFREEGPVKSEILTETDKYKGRKGR